MADEKLTLSQAVSMGLAPVVRNRPVPYVPTGLQEDIICAVGCGKWQIIWVEDANKVGKTRTLAEIAKNIIWPCDDKYFAWWEGDSVFSRWPFEAKAFRITGTPTNVGETGPVWKEIVNTWPKGRYTADKNGKHYYSQIKTDTGWSGDVMTYEQLPSEYEGPMLSLVLSDEPPKPKLVGAIMSRFAQGGIWLITATPIDCGGILDVLDDLETKGTRVKRLTGTVWENSKTSGKPNHDDTKRGLWTDAEIADYVATIPIDEQDARLKGIGNKKSGKIYGMFSEDIHVIDFDLDYLDQCDIYMSIDPHRSYYPAVKFYAVTPSSTIVQYAEWPTKEMMGGVYYDEIRGTKKIDLTMEQLANALMANSHASAHRTSIKAWTGDPRFLAEHEDYATSLQSYGLTGYRPAPFERVDSQRESLRSLLQVNKALPLCGHNVPGLYVDRRCHNSIRCYNRHYWGEKDKEAEEYKDFPDADRYFLSVFTNGRPLYESRRAPGFGQRIVGPGEASVANRPAQGSTTYAS
jgi:hypothetical protein